MAMQIKSKPGLIKAYNDCSNEVRGYFEHIPKLLDEFPMDVCLSYVFARLELGQNMALYCGAVWLYKANVDIAKKAFSIHEMTRAGRIELYKTIFGFSLPKTALADLKSAEKTRDTVMHGKKPSANDVRNAIARVLEYAEEVNKQLDKKYGLKPFGKLQGFSGATAKHDKKTTRFILKGMGLTIG